MFGIDLYTLAFTGLVGLAAVGIAYTFLFDKVEAEARQEKRIKSIKARQDSKTRQAAANRAQDASKRRANIQKQIKDLDKQSKSKANKRVPLKQLIAQAGLTLTVQHFFALSVVSAIVFGAGTFVLWGNPYVSAAAFAVGGLGVPRWVIGRMRTRRMKKFLEEFPNAVDVIVRGVKAGLPLNDCLGIIANESKDPVRSEFRRVVEAQQMGLPMADSIGKLYQNMPLTEANFFAIVITIQQQAGGNLSEALGNLSAVLRDRKKMKAKIQAMSAEAKASGMIIGALPLIVMLLVYLTTPGYILTLFTHPTGNLILLGSGIWMMIGVMVMKGMINFDF